MCTGRIGLAMRVSAWLDEKGSREEVVPFWSQSLGRDHAVYCKTIWGRKLLQDVITKASSASAGDALPDNPQISASYRF